MIDRFAALDGGGEQGELIIGYEIPSKEQVRVLQKKLADLPTSEQRKTTLQKIWTEYQKELNLLHGSNDVDVTASSPRATHKGENYHGGSPDRTPQPAAPGVSLDGGDRSHMLSTSDASCVSASMIDAKRNDNARMSRPAESMDRPLE